jgi:hypothetical protein
MECLEGVATEIDPEAVQRLHAEGFSQREPTRRMGIPRSLLHGHLKRTHPRILHISDQYRKEFPDGGATGVGSTPRSTRH